MYHLPDGYVSQAPEPWDDSGHTDDWQLEVYLAALGLATKHRLRTVLDVGTGSGYKLATYFASFDTCGTERPENVAGLRERWPFRRWAVSDLEDMPPLGHADLVVCADVIEHLPDPDVLMCYLGRVKWEWLVLSTPDRRLLHRPDEPEWLGPPVNPAHAREWTQAEFAAYVARWFPVAAHRIVNVDQATQMVVCVPQGARRSYP